MESCMPPGKEHIQRIVPNGLTELMFYFGDLPESLDRNRYIGEPALLSGQQLGYYDIRVSGHLSLFSINFHPQGLMVYFDIPLRELFNLTVPLRYILKDEVSELESLLIEASYSERISIVEAFLKRRFNRSKKKYQFERIVHSIGHINQSKGVMSINQLASAACLSRKQYERTFLDSVGTTPKQFLKTVRFQNAVDGKSKDSKMSLTELSYRCGYYDQSHMNGEFKSLAGMSPKQYFTECEPYSDYFA